MILEDFLLSSLLCKKRHVRAVSSGACFVEWSEEPLDELRCCDIPVGGTFIKSCQQRHVKRWAHVSFRGKAMFRSVEDMMLIQIDHKTN